MRTKHKQNWLCRVVSLLMIVGMLFAMTTLTATAYNTDTLNTTNNSSVTTNGNLVYRADNSAVTTVDKENDNENTDDEESGYSPIIFIIIIVVIIAVVFFVMKEKKNNKNITTTPSQPQYTIPPQNTNNTTKSNIVPNPNARNTTNRPTVPLQQGNNPSTNAPMSATLLYVRKAEKITLNKPEFIIGREKNKVDYCIINNVSVSRTHAKFSMRNGKYYITDLNSSNFTYLNNTRLHPYQEKEIHKGDKINISDEEFEFLG